MSQQRMNDHLHSSAEIIKIAKEIIRLHEITKPFYDGTLLERWYQNAKNAIKERKHQDAIALGEIKRPKERDHLIAEAIWILLSQQKEIDYSWKGFIRKYATSIRRDSRILWLCDNLKIDSVPHHILQYIEKEFLSKTAFDEKMPNSDRDCWKMMHSLQKFIKLYVCAALCWQSVEPIIKEYKVPKLKLNLLEQLCKMQINEDVKNVIIKFHGMDV